jgi:hypothetical protein
VECCDEFTANLDILSRIRTGCVDDPIITCRITFSEQHGHMTVWCYFVRTD